MAGSVNRGLLSTGVFLIILVISIILYVPLKLIDWWVIPSLMIALCGCWLIALGGMQASNPQKYARGAFSLFGWGLLFVAVGGALFLWGFGWFYSVILLLGVLGALAVAAAFRNK